MHIPYTCTCNFPCKRHPSGKHPLLLLYTGQLSAPGSLAQEIAVHVHELCHRNVNCKCMYILQTRKLNLNSQRREVLESRSETVNDDGSSGQNTTKSTFIYGYTCTCTCTQSYMYMHASTKMYCMDFL